jgi:hypothetical protein
VLELLFVIGEHAVVWECSETCGFRFSSKNGGSPGMKIELGFRSE